ncbi:hypothetical protein D9M68_395460 [compost metagenome]
MLSPPASAKPTSPGTRTQDTDMAARAPVVSDAASCPLIRRAMLRTLAKSSV